MRMKVNDQKAGALQVGIPGKRLFAGLVFMFSLIAICGLFDAAAQQATVKGTVRGPDGAVIPGCARRCCIRPISRITCTGTMTSLLTLIRASRE